MSIPTRPLDVAVIVHPPERRRQRSPVIAAQACCCCCCCCLHTLGGLVGALVGSLLRVRATPRPRDYDADDDIPFRRDELPPSFAVPAALVYWGLVSLGTMGMFLAGAFWSGTGKVSSSDLFGAGLVTILLLPVVQLGAFIVALIAVALCPQSLIPDKSAAVARVGYIGLWSFVGTIVGLGVMFLLCMALPLFQR